MDLWWRLPGPSRFVTSIVGDLRGGQSVVLATSSNAPGGLRDAVERLVTENDLWRWRRLDVCNDGCREPIEILFGQLLPSSGDDIATVQTFATSKACQGFIVWVDGVDRECWPKWEAFLRDYDLAARVSGAASPLLCLPVAGLPTTARALAGVSRRRWRGTVDRYDVALFVADRLRYRRLNPLHYHVSIALCTELAGTDAGLAARLAMADLQDQLAPVPLLLALAAERRLDADAVSAPGSGDDVSEDWDHGARFTSCAAAVIGRTSEVLRRVWKAEVSVLFPFIEEHRARLVRELSRYLRLPFETPFGVIKDRDDLEVGHLLILCRRHGAPRRTLRLLECLTRMRHSLAHLETVRFDDLNQPELLETACSG